MLRVLSLGAGVQSTTVALMALRGEIGDRLDAAIFADTGWEPEAVYAHLDWLERELVASGTPVHRVSAGNIRDLTLRRAAGDEVGNHMSSLPFHVANLEGQHAMLRRQCTTEFKIEPIRQEVKMLLGIKPRSPGPREVVAEQWMGISWDEYQRVRDSDVRWLVHRYPLIERRMTRANCLTWLERNGYPDPPKSSCVGCPFHHDAYWREMKRERPEEWADAVEFDAAIRRLPRIKGDAFLHRALVPLDQVDLRNDRDRGQLYLLDECKGYCGT